MKIDNFTLSKKVAMLFLKKMGQDLSHSLHFEIFFMLLKVFK